MIIEPVAKHERKLSYYIFERIPAIAFVSILAFVIFGGLVFPEFTAYLIIVLNVYFFYKSGMLALTFAMAYFKVRQGESINWQAKLNDLDDIPGSIARLKSEIERLEGLNFNDVPKPTEGKNFLSRFNAKLPSVFHRILFSREKRKSIKFLSKEIEKLKQTEVKLNWHEIQHIAIIPHVKEPEHILRETLDNLAQQTFPTKQINVVLAAEARDPNGLPLSEKLAAEYKHVFNNVWVSNHILTDEEIVGKSSNMKAGGKVAYDKVTELGWDLKKTMITSCDADSKLPKQYFAYVTHEYVQMEDAEYKYFNGAMVFYNNIWKLPFYARVKNSMSTLYNVSRLIRTDKLIPFSTYTTSFWMIKEIGFWTPWVTPEDFHLFFKAQFKFGAKVSAVPIFLRIMSDAAEGQGHIDTIRNNYMQERRWSWGISDDGWILQNVILNFSKHDFITIYRGLHSVFDHVMSPVMGVMILVGGNIPPLLNPAFNSTVLGAQLPRISSTIITLSLFFLIVVILLDIAFKPKRQNRLGILNIPIQMAEWLVLPLATLVLSLLPGIEANTRLLFGKYLEYYVTKKH
jgi:hypothetical protein